MIRFVLIPRFCELTGMSEDAVTRNIERGIWRRGEHYRVRGRRRWMDLEAVERWVEEDEGTASRSEGDQSALASLQQTVRATRRRSESTGDPSSQLQSTSA